MKTVPVESTAEAYLELLAARGVDYFFGNGGTDFGPIVDAYAKRLATEAPVPKPVIVPHEITAVAMAHGYTMVTMRPQVVMVHTIAGTANATGGLISANRALVPMLFSAGRTPLTDGDIRGARNNSIHWGQESFDQGGMVREWVKWDYELRAGADLEGVVDRALAISQTEPQGPVYLTLPREILAEERDSISYAETPRMNAGASMAAPDAIAEAVRLLARAKNPIAITRAIGRDTEAVAPLVHLCETLNMPLFEAGSTTHMNFPVGHRLYAGGGAQQNLASADVIVLLEADVPWMPNIGGPGPETTIIGIGEDPLFSTYPVRNFRVDLNLAGSAKLTLSSLADGLASAKLDASAIEERGRRWAAEHEKVRKNALERAEASRGEKPIGKAWGAHCIEQVRDDDTIIINELGVDTTQFEFKQPGSFYGTSNAGVLGWGVGAALGAKLAARDKTVIACVGDGSYMFGVPTAGHWVARKLNLPVLYIVWNNSRWNAVAAAARGVYPEGWAVKTDNFPFSDLSPSLDFELICQSAGGYGERVEDPEELPAALERALHAVRVEGRQALLNVIGATR